MLTQVVVSELKLEYPSEIYFIETSFGHYHSVKNYLVIVCENKVSKYEIKNAHHVDEFLSIDKNNIFLSINKSENLKGLILDFNFSNNTAITIFENIKNYYLVSSCINKNEIFINMAQNEHLRLEEDTLYIYSMINNELLPAKVDQSYNYDFLDVSADGKYLSFVHVGNIKSISEFTEYLLVHDFQKNTTVCIDSGCFRIDDSNVTQWVNGKLYYLKVEDNNLINTIYSYDMCSKKSDELYIGLEGGIKDFYYLNDEFFIISKEKKKGYYITSTFSKYPEIIYQPGKNTKVVLKFIKCQ